MYFTSGQDRAFERLMQEKPGFDHYDGGGANAPEDCGSCHFYRPDWKYQYCVYAECPYQPGKLTALAAVKFTVKGADDDMAVFRVEKNKGYTVMSNHHLRNKALSLKAKGLLSQMLSLPEDWDYTLKGLSLINRESIDAIRTAVWELERAGYIRREQGRDAKGKMADMVYTIYEQPVLDKPVLENPVLENPTSDNPTSDNPASGNPTQLNKEIQRTNLPRKEKLNTDGQSTDSIPFPSLTPAPARNEAAAAPPERKGTGKDAAVQIYREILLENIEYDYLIQDSSIDREQLDEIVDLMLETVCTSRKSIRIAGDDYPAELVKSKFMKLNSEHIRFVFDCLRENTTKVHNIKQYLRAIQEQKRAVRSGYDMDILPSDLATYGQDAKELLKTLQSRNERMFQITFLVMNTADTRQKLENDVFWAAGVAQKYNCSLVRLDYQQEQGLMSSLPLGANHIKIERSLTTSSVAVFVPFVTQELFMGGDAMYYGVNAKTGNMIMLDRKRARCPNGLKLGTPGSGKSMSCKSEIVSVFLCTPDDVYICDPEAEYYPLVKRLHGQAVKLSPTSKSYVNPLDINLNYSEDENPLALKSDFVLSFCELVMGGKNGLEAIEKTVIDRAVQVIYRPYLADPRPENMPILSDLHQALLDQHIPEADRVAQALDLYVNGSLNVFNHRTNVNIENRIVAFDIKELGKQLKKLGMLIVQDQIWGRVTQNRSQGKATWYFCDEFHLLLREEQTAAFSCEIWKRFRKWGGIPTGATQNVKDLLSSPEIENILENSDFICLLNQASGDRRILAERLNISPQQLRYVDNSEPGEGLLIYENVILPFRNPIPQRSQLYKIMTTRLGEGETV